MSVSDKNILLCFLGINEKLFLINDKEKIICLTILKILEIRYKGPNRNKIEKEGDENRSGFKEFKL